MRVIGFIIPGTLLISIAVMRTRLHPAKKSRAMLDLLAFKNAPISLFSLGLFLAFAGLYVPIFYIIIFSEVHVHVGTDLSFYLLAMLNGASGFGRIFPGLLADQFGALEMIVIFTVASAIFAYIGVVINSLGCLTVFAIFYGFLSGAVVSLPSAVVAAIAPMRLVGTWMGMSFCFAAIGILIGSPIAGTIINVPRNQFAGGFVFSGSVVMAAGVSFAVAKSIILLEKRKQKTEKAGEAGKG